jgi:glycosyltransferase involved in cell wall biosynthesis
MKILLVSTYDWQGGAAKAAYRLYQRLRRTAIDAQMLVQSKLSDEETIIGSLTKFQKGLTKAKPILEILPLQLYSQRDRVPYSLQWFPDTIASQVAQINPDLINLHWINAGYLQIETLAKLKKPIVWTLHDMWPFTGGCHYSNDCDRYTKSCGICPQLHSTREWDISRWVWQRKAKAWNNLNLTIVTPSNWLAKCARNSSLFQNFPIEVIPNGLDIQRYKPIDRQLAKNLLGFPSDKQIILFGANLATSDLRKGFHLLLPALQKLSQFQRQAQIELVIFGSSQPNEPPDFGFKTNYIGKLSDDISLSILYAAADIFIAPSLQDNLPNTVMEALACGTPCIAFKIGGMTDMIEHEQNGYLAQPYEVEDLAKGIIWVLEDKERWRKLSDRARKKVEQEFTLDLQAQQYLALYKELI